MDRPHFGERKAYFFYTLPKSQLGPKLPKPTRTTTPTSTCPIIPPPPTTSVPFLVLAQLTGPHKGGMATLLPAPEGGGVTTVSVHMHGELSVLLEGLETSSLTTLQACSVCIEMYNWKRITKPWSPLTSRLHNTVLLRVLALLRLDKQAGSRDPIHLNPDHHPTGNEWDLVIPLVQSRSRQPEKHGSIKRP